MEVNKKEDVMAVAEMEEGYMEVGGWVGAREDTWAVEVRVEAAKAEAVSHIKPKEEADASMVVDHKAGLFLFAVQSSWKHCIHDVLRRGEELRKGEVVDRP